MATALLLTGNDLTIDDVVAVARSERDVSQRLSPAAERAMQSSRQWLEDALAQDTAIYGVTTGFGKQSNIMLRPDQIQALSRNLIVSHATAVGDPLPDEIVRAAMLIRANALTKGYSGVRRELIQTLIQMLNRRVTPIVPRKGSLGASGDLALLSHVGLVMSAPLDHELSEHNPYGGQGGFARYGAAVVTGAEAMRQAGIPRYALSAKEGLALNNGATFSTAIAALINHDALQLLATAEIALALTMEALRSTTDAFLPYPHRVRNHLGQQISARNVRRLLQASTLVQQGPLSGDEGVQDAYSVRCAPQVLGAVRDTLRFAHQTIVDEINAATDNPLFFLEELEREGKALSAGNFHGEPIAFALDFMKIALTEVASIAERRTFRLIDPRDSRGLPGFLVADAQSQGLSSGFMVPQYTAAALVSECKTLAHPDSVDSIPSSANQEDHVSMSANAGLHALEILANAEQVVAIELLTAAQAVELRQQQMPAARPGIGTSAALAVLREDLGIPFAEHDRAFAPDIERIRAAIHAGRLLHVIDAALRQRGIAPLLRLPPTDEAAWAEIRETPTHSQNSNGLSSSRRRRHGH